VRARGMRRSSLIRIALAWLACVTLGSLFPWRPWVAAGSIRIVAHLAVFSSTTMLLLLIARSPRQRLAAPVAVVALGIAIECAQHWIYRGPLEWWDMRVDAYAAIGAYLLASLPPLRSVLERERT